MIKAPSRIQRLKKELSEIISKTEAGGRLLSEPALAKQLGVSRATLREAMRTFEIQGLIRRRQGSGTYVSHLSQTIESGLEKLESIETMAERIGLAVQMVDKKVIEKPASKDEASIFNIEIGSNVFHVARVMYTESRPVAYLVDAIPANMLATGELKDGFNGSVLDYLIQLEKANLTSSRCEITAVPASSEVARLLEIQRSDVLLKFDSYLFNEEGAVVDYSFSYFLPGYFRFHVVRKIS